MVCGMGAIAAQWYCSKRRSWKRVAAILHQRYNMKLNAAVRDGYHAMYSYITARKLPVKGFCGKQKPFTLAQLAWLLACKPGVSKQSGAREAKFCAAALKARANESQPREGAHVCHWGL